MGLPATAVAIWFCLRYAPTPELRVICTAILIVFWVGCALAVRRRLIFPLQTLANLVEAIRCGDYTLRGRRAARGGTLGEVVREINELGETLQRQRLQTPETTALGHTRLEEAQTPVIAVA